MVDPSGSEPRRFLPPCRPLVMAFFMTNVCKFRECNLSFTSLALLIEHIEEKHIDNDPSFLEKQEGQQPTSLALSYVMRFVTDAAKHQPKEKKKSKLYKSSSAKSIIGSKGDFDRLHSDSEEEGLLAKLSGPYNADLFLQGRRKAEGNRSKPYVCPVPGCKKRYKNLNGMKYHCKNGHRKDKFEKDRPEKDKSEKVKKTYKCECGKSYRSSQGLRHHMLAQHSSSCTQLAPKKKQASVKSSTIGSVAPSLFTTGNRVGVSLATGSFLLDHCAPLGNPSVVMEQVSATGSAQGQRVVVSSAPPTGFTLVTLPSSASLGSIKGLVQAKVQITAGGAAARLEQSGNSAKRTDSTVRTVTPTTENVRVVTQGKKDTRTDSYSAMNS